MDILCGSCDLCFKSAVKLCELCFYFLFELWLTEHAFGKIFGYRLKGVMQSMVLVLMHKTLFLIFEALAFICLRSPREDFSKKGKKKLASVEITFLV